MHMVGYALQNIQLQIPHCHVFAIVNLSGRSGDPSGCEEGKHARPLTVMHTGMMYRVICTVRVSRFLRLNKLEK